ncbi:MAG TPA: hypothetical protein VHU83_20530 [Bryobacteraceae bacterium]|jgi:UDP-N-acetylmuramoyl-tripeptide--D-alanyl-D-alanine ligase|nr:hypothetical protein [Bryobacteraceae bacterium]
MIDLLAEQRAARRVAVLGEMLELGSFTEALHREVGRHIYKAGLDILVGIGKASRFMIDEATKAGLASDAAFWFEHSEAAGLFLRTFVRPGDAILFKGSRATRIEMALSTFQAGQQPV